MTVTPNTKKIILIIAVVIVICLVAYIVYNKSGAENFSGAFDPSTRASINGIGPQTVTANENGMYCANCM